MQDTLAQGFLVLADISGFTTYLSQSELDHANAILSELAEVVISHLAPFLILVEVEGDATYGYIPEERVERGETMLELFEATYVAFRDRLAGVKRRTTCECNACRALPGLDLKFICHYGEYALQTVAGKSKPLGSAVNMAHRLMKNRVTQTTGWRGYILLTQAAFDQLRLSQALFRRDEDDVADFGRVTIYCLDLNERYQETVGLRRVVVDEDQADFVLPFEVPAAPPIVWEWLNDPVKRAMGTQLTFRPFPLPNGRMGPGASNHCIHGKDVAMIQTILDWRPFDYFTQEVDVSGVFGKVLQETIRLEPTPGGTKVVYRIRLTRRPLWFGRLFFRVFVWKQYLAIPTRLRSLIADHHPA
jgi:hypothetical protein